MKFCHLTIRLYKVLQAQGVCNPLCLLQSLSNTCYSAKEPEKLSMSALGSLCISLSTQEDPECLVHTLGNLKPCQCAMEKYRILTVSQSLLESFPNISGTPGALSLASRNTGLSSLANETQKYSHYAEGGVKPSSVTETQESMAFS